MKTGKRFIKKKRNNIVFFTIILLIIILALVLVLIGKIIGDKLGSITFKNIDKSDLAINNGLYDIVSNTLTSNEFNSVKNILLFGIDSKDSDRKSYKKN